MAHMYLLFRFKSGWGGGLVNKITLDNLKILKILNSDILGASNGQNKNVHLRLG